MISLKFVKRESRKRDRKRPRAFLKIGKKGYHVSMEEVVTLQSECAIVLGDAWEAGELKS